MESLIALAALTAMEIVLGIDNIIFLVILTSRLPPHQQARARTIGLMLAMGMRIVLLLALSWILGMKEAVFHLTDLGIPAAWLGEGMEHTNEVSWRDIILLAGGLFLVGKSVHEIHEKLEGPGDEDRAVRAAGFLGTMVAIVMIDIVFSLDSVITAVGMARDLWVMVTAVVIAVGVMLIFAGKIGAFVERHPTLKMLALSFLILIGVMLIAESLGREIEKGYIYFAMAFALGVELLNLKVRGHLPPQPAEAKGP